MNKTDHTAAIFTAMGITPEKQPWAYKHRDYQCACFEFYASHHPECPTQQMEPIPLLSNSLEADGLAVRLWCEVYKDGGYELFYEDTYAAAVHDALVDALGIEEDTP